MQTKQIGEAYYRLLHQLQQLDFALVELNLYLDTHPNDPDALRQFNTLARQRQEAAEQFERQFGPLMHFGHSFSREPWQWNDTPWPWQV